MGAAEFRGNFIGGEFKIPSDPSESWVVKSPANLSDEVLRVQASYRVLDEAVQSATSAFKEWRRISSSQRAEHLKKYRSALERRKQDLVTAISREVGKPAWESELEYRSLIDSIDVTLAESPQWIQPLEVPHASGVQGFYRYRPEGVLAVIGPFPAPAALPNEHLLPALLAGNTVLFKPSEKAPLVGQLLAECFQEAEIPRGVFNLIQGEREVGRRLTLHEGIHGILFTGSYEVGARIRQETLQQSWKRVVLEMGGKNSTLVWNDADLEFAIDATLKSAYWSAGQRCTSTSRVIVHEAVAEKFIALFHERAKAFKIGPPSEDPFMGPLIDSSSVDRSMKFLGIAQREGWELIMRGKSVEPSGLKGHYVTPSICWNPNVSIEQSRKSVYQQTEILAPNVAILQARELDEAIAQANITQYGRVASVFTRSQEIFEKCLDELEVGWVNWNLPTVQGSPRLPSGGLKKSGNHQPTGLAAIAYCASPVSALRPQ